jgi:hypothetical protein
MENMIGDYRQFHNDEYDNLCYSQYSYIRVFYQNDQVKEEERGRACSTRERNEKCTINFEERNRGNHFGDLGINGRIILK